MVTTHNTQHLRNAFETCSLCGYTWPCPSRVAQLRAETGPPPPIPPNEGTPMAPPDPDARTVDERAALLSAWFESWTAATIDQVVPKAAAYGAADLQIMGAALGALVPGDWSPEELQRMACGFYALGKVARLFGAWAQGKTPHDDTWYDLGIYALIAQKITDTGEWP